MAMLGLIVAGGLVPPGWSRGWFFDNIGESVLKLEDFDFKPFGSEKDQHQKIKLEDPPDIIQID